tara:strand:- start:474 stop:578 length:105 start_codon:yes stop_codon:yes gene_type:complete
MIQGSEEVYEAFFYKILEWDAVQRINQRNKDEQE